MKASQKKLYERKAEILAAAGHPIRLAIIDLLAGGEKCVCEIVEQVAAERSNVSRHLAVLLKAGVVENRKEGLKVIYSLKTPCIMGFLSCVSQVLREKLKQEQSLLKQL